MRERVKPYPRTHVTKTEELEPKNGKNPVGRPLQAPSVPEEPDRRGRSDSCKEEERRLATLGYTLCDEHAS